MKTNILLRSVCFAALAVSCQAQAAAIADTAATDADTITVTATRTEKAVIDVPATVSVIDAQTIDDRFVNDVKDLVRYEPGVTVRRAPARFTAAGSSTGRDRDSGFNIRGLEGNRVLITIDGVRVPDGFSFGAQSVGRGDYVDLDLIKSVEILRGPASALYGSDGVAGAVSFVTKDPIDFLKDGKSVGGGVRVGYDSSDESWVKGGVAAAKAGDISAMVAYTRRDGKELDNKGSNDAANVDRTTPNPQDTASNAVLGRLVWQPEDAHRLRFTYEHFDSDVDTNVLSAIAKPPLAATSVLGLTAADDMKRNRGTIDYRYVGEGLLSGARAAIWYQKSETLQTAIEDRNTAADRIRINRFDNRVWGAMLQLETKFETGDIEHLIVYGADHSETKQTGVRDGTVPPAGEAYPTRAFPTTDYDLTGLFVQDEISIADGLVTLFPALRWDHYKLKPKADALFSGFVPQGQSDSKLTPRIGVVVKPSENIRLFGNYTQGFKAPEPNQLNNSFANVVANYRSIPNPNLKPETSRSVEGGVRFVDAHGSAELVGFSSRFRNFIDQIQIGGTFTAANPAVYQYVNLGRVKIHGIEAKGEYRTDLGLGVRAAASWAKGSVRQTGVAGTRPLDSVEPFKFVAGAFYQPEGGAFRGEVVWTHSAGKKQSRTNNSCNTATTVCFTPPGFWVLDATASYKLMEHATVRVGLFNIFDKKYFWWSDARGLASNSTIRDAFSQPGRNFGASLTLSL
ncbi:TonB-dependent hemoglobin/transferrin/lactoferrin family receptor [Sphingomonas montanisoli]|uniref:TonB-dependent hemoglobin/transferrin/lactoferrin family receptor n=1 Tax=Sphingomonas montanisoli TaxID=2606412 RepID=A0A5D9CE45_9SPHN|nr:TonB-dependent hemoglobin/transferrin/lactoferrin family receptor [Sphingomonas montanisoli]TZG29250.1 TonB-dependent hemoglobin/transferrin/lactoferrin family receptor [Sphingomonas montanisoli]